MRFSIIVPVHNEQAYINRCVESLLNQTYGIDEIILVNDHSIDDSAKICKEYVEQYENVKFYESKDYGVSSARNVGLKYATGDIIGFCDCDDFYELDAIENVTNCFNKNASIKMVVTSLYRTTYVNNVIKKNYVGTIGNELYLSKDKIACAVIDDRRVLGSVCNKYFSRSIIENICFDTSLTHCEDLHFLVRAILRCADYEIFVINRETYNYVYNVNSVTNDIGKTIDENGEIRYNLARKALLNEPLISKKMCQFLKSNSLQAWLEYYSSTVLTEKETKVFVEHLKDDFWAYILCFKHNAFYKIKLIIKCFYKVIFKRTYVK